MKTKLFTALALLTVGITAFVFNSSPEKTASYMPPSLITDNEFMIGVMDCAWDNDYGDLPVLGLNAWHKYTKAVPPNDGVAGWLEMGINLNHIPEDRYSNLIGAYEEKIQNRIDANRNNGMRSIMDRPKIGYLAYGQRSDYQSEQEVHLTSEFSNYKFYTYNNSIDNDFNINDIPDNSAFGEGEVVKHCVPDPNQTDGGADWIVSGLKANHEQANYDYGFMKGDRFCNWYVKPRIRIPTGLPDNTPVCTIEILNWNGQPVTAFPNGKAITASNFKDQNGNYSGEYLDEFYFSPGVQSAILIPEQQICPAPSKNFTQWPGGIATDFRVRWSGACEMWIDRVRVENEPAHELFAPGDPFQWEAQIRDEVSELALHHSDLPGYVPNMFYQEEMEFNCLPSIKRVNEIIQDEAAINGVELSLMVNINYDLFKVHVPTCWTGYDITADQMKTFLVDSGNVKTVVVTSYPLTGWSGTESPRGELGDHSQPLSVSKHPNTLSTSDWNKNIGILSNSASPVVYDEWLQGALDNIVTSNMGFVKDLKLFDAASKIPPGIRIILPPSLVFSPTTKLLQLNNLS